MTGSLWVALALSTCVSYSRRSAARDEELPSTPRLTTTIAPFSRDGDGVEIGSIGIQHDGGWSWGIDTVIPMRAWETQGEGRDHRDCMRSFKAAWERFAADEANLTEFLKMKRQRR